MTERDGPSETAEEVPRIHPRLSVGLRSLLFGLLAGLGAALLTQQLGWVPLTTGNLWLWLAAGALAGPLLRTVGYAIGVKAANRRAKRAEEDPS